MRLRVERATFGERRGGHSLLYASLPDSAELRAVARATDLPQDLPATLTWEPFFRGFATNDWYVLAKTFPDPAATRPGMVRTFAILLDSAKLAMCNLLSPLFALLPLSLDDEWHAEASEIEICDKDPRVEPPGFAALVRALTHDHGKRGVWLGSEGFLDAVNALWLALWPKARQQFRFGLHFAPRDAPKQMFSLVLVPPALAGRWSDFACVDRNSPEPSSPSSSEGYLRRLPAGAPIRELFTVLGVEPASLEDIQTASKCSELLARRGSASLGEKRALLRYLVHLAPDPTDGAAWKTEVLEQLLGGTASGTADDALALRTLYQLPLPEIGARTDHAVAAWFNRRLGNVEQADNARSVLLEALRTPSEPWGQAVLSTIQAAWSVWRDEFANTVWSWWTQVETLVDDLAPYLPPSPSTERSFISTYPSSIVSSLTRRVRKFAVDRGWLTLHAATCAEDMGPTEAFEAQLTVDRAFGASSGLTLLSKRFAPTATVNAFLRHNDPRLGNLAASFCTKEPELLLPWKTNDPTWRALLAETLGISSKVWMSLGTNRAALRDNLATCLLHGEAQEEQIWNAISQSSEADFSGITRRKDLWNLLPTTLLPRFLDATTVGWIARFQQTPGFETSLEPALGKLVFPAGAQSALLDARSNQTAATALAAFTHFAILDQRHFCRWLQDVELRRPPVSHRLAEQLGELVVGRNWVEAAEALGGLAARAPEWKPAARKCLGIVGFVKRFLLQWRLGDNEMSESDFWNALEELAVDHYRYGPDTKMLWSRAEGHESDLPVRDTGAEAWAATIKLLRKGGGKKVSARSLLKIMRDDFSQNNDFRVLEDFAKSKKL